MATQEKLDSNPQGLVDTGPEITPLQKLRNLKFTRVAPAQTDFFQSGSGSLGTPEVGFNPNPFANAQDFPTASAQPSYSQEDISQTNLHEPQLPVETNDFQAEIPTLVESEVPVTENLQPVEPIPAIIKPSENKVDKKPDVVENPVEKVVREVDLGKAIGSISVTKQPDKYEQVLAKYLAKNATDIYGAA